MIILIAHLNTYLFSVQELEKQQEQLMMTEEDNKMEVEKKMREIQHRKAKVDLTKR